MSIIDFIFPRQCVNCGIIGAYLCKCCKKRLQPHPEICPICHRFSADYKVCLNCKSEKNFCFRTPTQKNGVGGENHIGDFGNIKQEGKGNDLGFQKQSVFLEGIIIPFAYDDLLKKLILRLKYFHKKDIGGFLVERLKIALEVNQSFQNSALGTLNSILITRVPTHRYREYFVKGYNQSKILAKKLSEVTGIPRAEIAKKKKHTKTQASLNREGRLKNLKNAFSLTKNLKLQGNETMLIVDDVTTTGSTINELAKLIKFHYPKIKVRGAVLGRHMG